MKIQLIAISTSALILTACATSVLRSSPDNVVTESFTPNYEGAKKVADIECGKYKRVAKMTSGVDPMSKKIFFDCIDSDNKNNYSEKLESVTAQRLKELNELHKQGLINNKDFESKKAEILKSM